MSVWIVLGWEENYGNWEVLSVLFDAAEVDARVEEIFTEFMNYESVKVEYWHRDDADSPTANFYGAEYYYNDDDEEV